MFLCNGFRGLSRYNWNGSRAMTFRIFPQVVRSLQSLLNEKMTANSRESPACGNYVPSIAIYRRTGSDGTDEGDCWLRFKHALQ